MLSMRPPWRRNSHRRARHQCRRSVATESVPPVMPSLHGTVGRIVRLSKETALLSMTGFGGANTRRNGYLVASEIKTVSNRYFKTALRISDGFSSWKRNSESLLRSKIDRGMINVQPESDANRGPAFRSTTPRSPIISAVGGRRLCRGRSSAGISDYLRLPGVIDESAEGEDADAAWEAVQENIGQALLALGECVRGRNEMEKALRAYCADLTEQIDRSRRLCRRFRRTASFSSASRRSWPNTI